MNVFRNLSQGIPTNSIDNAKQEEEKNLDSYNIALKDFGYEFIGEAEKQFEDVAKLVEMQADKLQQNQYLLPGNQEKTRLACRVFPFDHTLLSSESVPYANGSLIFVPESSQFLYIAMQAPLNRTVQDMFTIMKEKKSSTLVSLVMPFESKLEKKGEAITEVEYERCADFWNGNLHFENGCTLSSCELETIKFDHTKQSIVIRKLTMKQPDGLEHAVEQFHYQYWPDHGTPDPLVFDKLNEKLNLKLEIDRSDESGPPVVHCHAGSGRTGVLIAILLIQDYIGEQIKKGSDLSEIKINIPQIIYKMKLCRKMINGLDQYQFVLSWTKAYIDNLRKK